MIIRIVKLTFKRENIASFEQIFTQTKVRIRNSKGCTKLELYQSKEDPCIFFTYSYWQSDADLEAYRGSDFFKAVWEKTKILFGDKPQAWSLNLKETLS